MIHNSITFYEVEAESTARISANLLMGPLELHVTFSHWWDFADVHMEFLGETYKVKTIIIYCKNNYFIFNLVMQKTYNKFDIVVDIAVCTHFNMISILAS